MCNSVMSNYSAWLQSFIVSIILLLTGTSTNNKNDIWAGVVTLTVTQIQVIESIIWGYYESKNYDKANEMTKYIVPLLWLQPLVNCVAGYVVTRNDHLLKLIYMYSILFIYDTYNAFNYDKFSVEIGANGHLIWKRNGNVSILSNNVFGGLYLAGLFVPFLFMEDKKMRLVVLAFIITTFVILNYQYDDEFNSVWCYVSATFSAVVLGTKLLIN